MSFLILLCGLLLPSVAFAQSGLPPDGCRPITVLGDLKGDGGEEQVILDKIAVQKDCAVKDLSIYDNNGMAYQDVINPDPSPGDIIGTIDEFNIEHLHNGPGDQVYYCYFHSDAGGTDVKVVEWTNGRFRVTLNENGRWIERRDFKDDGNPAIIVYGSSYDASIPEIYEFNPGQKRYLNTSKRHTGFYRDFIESCEENMREHPEEGHDCCHRGDNLEKIITAATLLGDREKAEDALRRESDMFVEYGKAYYREGKYATAVQDYSYAIDKNPRNWKAFGLRGYSYLKLHDVQKAVDSLETSVQLNPRYVEGHYNLALAYWASVVDRVRAVDEVGKAIGLDPSCRNKIKTDPQFKDFRVSGDFNNLINRKAPVASEGINGRKN